MIHTADGTDIIDSRLSPGHRRFREELRTLLTGDEMADALATAQSAGDDPDPRPIHRVLGKRGWLAPHWPERYGGIGVDEITASIVTEELAMHWIPDSAHVNTIRNAGSYLLRSGTDRQRETYLPPLARGDALMAVLYSEPDIGSDLAALTTVARETEGNWLLSGTKMYSVKTAAADYGLVAARTSRHANNLVGITLFVVPLDTPGVLVRQIGTMNPEPFYQVTFDDVVVGPEQVVGPRDGGWLVVTEALAMERVGIDFNAKARAWLDRITAMPTDDPAIARAVRDADTMVQAGRSLAWAMMRKLADGELDPAEAAMSKWFNSELGALLARLMLAAAGPDGLVTGTRTEAMLREAPGLTLSAGTSEMMLYVIADQLALRGDDHG